MRFLLLALLVIKCTSAQTDYSMVRQQIDSLLKDTFFISSNISISISDLTEKQTIYEKDVKKLYRPASNMKILTTAAGLLFLGPEYNFTTSVYYTGSIINNTLYGDLYIKGGFDPDFTTKDLDTILYSISALGIKEISGKVYGDISAKDSLFWGRGWMWDDDPSTDAPYLSALNINDNAVKFLIKPGILNTPVLISTEPETEYVSIGNNSITSISQTQPFYIDRNWINRTNNFTVEGDFLQQDTGVAVILNIFEPEKYFMTLFHEHLNKSGIKANPGILFSTVPANAYRIMDFIRPFDTVLINLNKVSDNLSAEMLLFAIAGKFTDLPASAINGLVYVDSLIKLAGADPQNYVLADGSGVSHYNLITAELLNKVLQYMFYKQYPLYEKLYNSFPSAGVDGTLKNRMTGTTSQNNVHAKTGTLSGVSTLSGYLTTQKGNKISFSIMIQNYKGSSAAARYFQDQICNILTR